MNPTPTPNPLIRTATYSSTLMPAVITPTLTLGAIPLTEPIDLVSA